MNRIVAFAVLAIGALAAQAAKIEQVIVRQQWPWSTDVKVEYRLSGVTSPVNIAVTAYDGEAELPLPSSAIVGDLYGVATDGIGQFVIDPVAAFGTAKVALANFKVKLAVSDAPANMSEVLYKIFDLTDGSCQDVTRADILNGKMGSYETDFGKIGDGYKTSLSDVLIWTGVTNEAKYATTCLVMRKVKAKDITWTMGSPVDERDHRDDEFAHEIKLTKDYFIGVFPVTVGQVSQSALAVSGVTRYEYGNYETAHGDKDRMPATTSLTFLRGSDYIWPQDAHAVTTGRWLDKLRGLTGVVGLDLPTEAQWEFACRAGTDTILYDGKSYSMAAASYHSAAQQLGFFSNNSQGEGTGKGFWQVGLKRPNAYGLYDMVGNIGERCLDVYDAAYGAPDGVSVDPVGATAGQGTDNVRRGGNYSLDLSFSRSARRYKSMNGGLEGARLVFAID